MQPRSLLSRFWSPQDAVAQRFVRGSVWSLVAAVSARGSTLLAAVLVARLLGSEGYGQLGIINNTVWMFGSVAGLGLGVVCTRYVAELRLSAPERAGGILALARVAVWSWSGSLGLLLLALAPWLAERQLAAPQLVGELRFAALMLLLRSVVDVQIGALAGFQAFSTIARVSAVQGLSALPLMWAGVWWLDLWGALLGLTLNTGLAAAMNAYALARLTGSHGIRLSPSAALAELPALWKLGLPAMLASLLVAPVMWLASAMLARGPQGYSELGIFMAGYQWYLWLGFLPGVLGRVLLPLLAEQGPQEDLRLEALNVLSGWIAVCLMALPLMCLPELVTRFYGPDYADPRFSACLALLVLSSCVVAFKGGIGRKLVTRELVWFSVGSNLLWCLVFLGLLQLLREQGALGMALAFSGGQLLTSLVVVPFYLWQRLVPRMFLISGWTLTLWLLLLLGVGLSVLTVAWPWRLLVLLVATALTLLTTRALWRRSSPV